MIPMRVALQGFVPGARFSLAVATQGFQPLTAGAIEEVLGGAAAVARRRLDDTMELLEQFLDRRAAERARRAALMREAEPLPDMVSDEMVSRVSGALEALREPGRQMSLADEGALRSVLAAARARVGTGRDAAETARLKRVRNRWRAMILAALLLMLS